MNAATLPHDPALPQLARALDAGAMAQVFAELLQGGGATLLRCQVDRVKYRAHRNLLVAYVLDLQDAHGPFTQRVAARLCTAGESARRHAKAAARPLQASRAGPALSHVAGLEMSAHWWPNDAKLPACAVLNDPDALQQHWLPEVAHRLGAGPCLGHRVELVQLVPEHRVTARVHLHTACAPGAAGDRLQSHMVYAKSDAEALGSVTQAVMDSLWHSPARRDGRLAMPRPLMWQAGSHLHWQTAVPGRVLAQAHTAPDARQAEAVGRLLAALHGTPAPAAPQLTLAGLHQRLQAITQLMCELQPALAARVGRVAAALDAGLSHISTGVQATCTLHGDLHPGNMLLDGERLSLIDLDGACQGPALLELGSWLADALYRGQLQGHAHDAIEAGRSGFMAGYAQAGGQAFGSRQLSWATAWQLWCQRAWRCIVNLKPGRYALLPGLLALTEALLSSSDVPASSTQELSA